MSNILSTLDNEDLLLISYININKNKLIFEEDSKCNYVGIVIEGKISITSYTYDGKEIVYSVVNEDELFGHNLIFSSHPFYKGNVIALKDSKLALISKENLIKILKKNQTFLAHYMQILNDNTKSLNEKVKLLSFDSASDRLLYYLSKNNNIIKFESITSLASLLFLRRETLSRTISKLVKNGVIDFNNNKITMKKG